MRAGRYEFYASKQPRGVAEPGLHVRRYTHGYVERTLFMPFGFFATLMKRPRREET